MVKKGEWQTIAIECQNQETGELREFVNVVPLFGGHHLLSPSCYCDPNVDEHGMVLHNVIH